MPAGLAFVRMVGTTIVDPGVTFTGSATPVVTDSGRTVTFNLAQGSLSLLSGGTTFGALPLNMNSGAVFNRGQVGMDCIAASKGVYLAVAGRSDTQPFP